MITGMDSFYQLTVRDAFRAGEAMADAFADDPVWRKVFEGVSEFDQKHQAFFEIPVRHCLKYGKVYAASTNLEGLIAWVPGEVSDITLWRFLRCGAFGCGMRMGSSASKRMSGLRVLSADRAANSGGRPYIYVLLLGVRTAHQGKKLASSLLRALLADCDAKKLPIFLETETEENVRMYEHFGFKLIRKIIIEGLGLPMWEMVREAQSIGPQES
jgi:ribosomal protein S18 acetylase RimI-like enzyme